MDKITKEELFELFKWVISPSIEVQGISEIEAKLREKYFILPERIWTYGKTFEYSIDHFLIEILQRIDYSPHLLFLLLNRGRKYLYFLWVILSIIILLIIFSCGMILNIFPINSDFFPVILFLSIIVIFIIQKCLDKLFDRIIMHMKPGDLLKILSADDEVVIKNVKPPQIKEDNIFSNPSVTVGFSKKKMICEDYRNKMKSKQKNLYNLTVLFIATDYLISIEQNIEIKNYLFEQAIEILTYILAFRSDSLFTLYYLAKYELELMNFNESKNFFIRILEIQDNNIEINAWINVLNFISDKGDSNGT
jgi:hypothetical protein